MASERQIVANRRNGRRSLGPRSAAGKKRASRNSFRHGLSALVPSTAERAECIERLSRKLAGNKTDPITVEYANTVAVAEFDLAQVRRVKVAIIDRILVFGEPESLQGFTPAKQAARFLIGLNHGSLKTSAVAESVSPIPSTEPERTAEAVRRVLPELLKLDRYERRAAARRDRSARVIMGK